ncbi:DEAD/DEAH box helicase [Paenibacillus sp. GCM10023252]|uniref:DEAD/DEAH box helicase n=1 Tax=Paenibacillus sp. GCM10023252 TaxID=3252649 RepID=UPI003614C85B
MRTRVGSGLLAVDGYWRDSDGQGCGIVLRSTAKDEPTRRMRSLLFAWHHPSWYGTEIEEVEQDEGSELLVSPLMAVDYLSAPAHVHLLQVQWSERLQVFMELAERIRTLLLHGWFVPDYERWTERNRAWKPSIPEEEEAFHELWDGCLLKLRALNEEGAAASWLSETIEQLIVSDEEVGASWKRVSTAAGHSGLSYKSAVEEDWLVAIGLQKDNSPFRVALQLAEPDDQQGWHLRPALQHREGGPWLPIRLNEAESHYEAVPPQSDLNDGAAPAIPLEWEPMLEARLTKEHARWIGALPDWEDPNRPGRLRQELTEEEVWIFLEEASLRLLDAGCPVLLPGWWEAVRSRKLRLKAKMKSSTGSSEQPMFGLDQIVQFDWKLALGDVVMSEAEFMRLAEENRRLVKIGGEWVHLDPNDVDQIRHWMKRVGKRKGLSFRDVLEMHLRGGAPLDGGDEDGESLRAEVELNEHLASWLEQLQHTSQIPLVDKPEQFLGELRPYQQQGVSWLLFLRRFGLGGCLADDMGLGKTIQFMAYLAHVKENGLSSGSPSLLICPTSVIGNWEKELEKFAPTLRVVLHYGPKRDHGEALARSIEGADLVITSYSLAQLDEEDLSGVYWDALCLDEAQNIKNVYTKQSSAIRRLPAGHRIALTGTPMENRLTELWSIYDYINPGYLGSISEFRRAVVAPIERTRDEEIIAGLQRWVKPFMLRRVKKDPAIQLSLPDKNEAKTYISLTAEQGAVYENIVSDLLEKLDTLGPLQRRGLILATLTKLKQLCNHPGLLAGEKREAAWDIERSNKMLRLLEMVEEIAAEGERCLIFTQYVEMGLQLQRMLEEKLGLPVPYLHGGVPKVKRDEMISTFQDEEQPCCAFVLSLKAGGTGLNLTAANHVFHFDRWWNPAVENQATDRAFRIGQTRKVQVHKFVTLGTLEEKVDAMIERKQSLNEQVVGQSEQWITELSTDELKELFALRKSWLKN